jgi:hypothetical protein
VWRDTEERKREAEAETEKEELFRRPPFGEIPDAVAFAEYELTHHRIKKRKKKKASD